MITYHALGYWGLPALLAAAVLLKALPRDSRAHQLLARAALLGLLLIAAIVGLSY
ncbi:hypothetical protein ACFXOS_19790 [Streptomyces sp. NPDC059175]|uniref:hypothetical protein n=1 Tax=Streptomyces sp. NPDC059175 TaxID=3346757 RepID=UPI0036C75B20